MTGIKTSLINILIHIYENDKEAVKELLYKDITFDKLRVKMQRYSVKNICNEITKTVERKEYILIIDNVDRISPKGVEMLEYLKDTFIIFTSARNVMLNKSSFTWNFDVLELKPFCRTISFDLINKLT